MSTPDAAAATAPGTTAFAVTVATPDGPFTIIAGDGCVLASGWTEDVESLAALIHRTVRPTVIRMVASEHPCVKSAADAVDAYYAGDFAAISTIAVRQISGPFRQHAWDVLRSVDAGKPVTYTEYAALSGRPRATRAAAGACAMNAVALFVPCHRVLRTDGTLGGFRYGLQVKRSLLERESGARAGSGDERL